MSDATAPSASQPVWFGSAGPDGKRQLEMAINGERLEVPPTCPLCGEDTRELDSVTISDRGRAYVECANCGSNLRLFPRKPEPTGPMVTADEQGRMVAGMELVAYREDAAGLPSVIYFAKGDVVMAVNLQGYTLCPVERAPEWAQKNLAAARAADARRISELPSAEDVAIRHASPGFLPQHRWMGREALEVDLAAAASADRTSLPYDAMGTYGGSAGPSYGFHPDPQPQRYFVNGLEATREEAQAALAKERELGVDPPVTAEDCRLGRPRTAADCMRDPPPEFAEALSNAILAPLLDRMEQVTREGSFGLAALDPTVRSLPTDVAGSLRRLGWDISNEGTATRPDVALVVLSRPSGQKPEVLCFGRRLRQAEADGLLLQAAMQPPKP